MSRNFELLKQLEKEVDVGKPSRAETNGVIAKQVSPNDAGDLELLKQLEIEVDVANPSRTEADDVIAKQVSPSDAGDLFGEETVRLVQTVFLSRNRRAPRQVVFCGVDGENGSSSVCASAGRALTAISDKSVCLVDANVHSPRLSNAFGINRSILLPTNAASVRERCVHIDGNLWLAGTDLLVDNCGSLLSLAELKRRFTQLEGDFDYLLVDAPGVGVSRDAALLGEIAGAAILVIEANTTRRLAARRAKESLEAAGVRLLGTVLRNRSFPIPEKLFKRL
jgi:Mrp family chromosome partitioning ATPase